MKISDQKKGTLDASASRVFAVEKKIKAQTIILPCVFEQPPIGWLATGF